MQQARAEQLIAEIETRLGELKAIVQGTARVESDEDRWFRTKSGPFLNDLDQLNRPISSGELSEIARRHGYAPNGIGGFARGNNPCIVSQGETRVLTARGKGEAARWRATFSPWSVNVDLESTNVPGAEPNCREHPEAGTHYDVTIHPPDCPHHDQSRRASSDRRYWRDFETEQQARDFAATIRGDTSTKPPVLVRECRR